MSFRSIYDCGAYISVADIKESTTVKKTAVNEVDNIKENMKLIEENKKMAHEISLLKKDNSVLKEMLEEKIPERYIVNKNASILFWKNGEKTIVKKCEDDDFNARLGFLTAFFQRHCGMSKNKANKYLANIEENIEEVKDGK